MNGKPHTHELKLRDRRMYHRWVIEYGDQRATVVQWVPGSKKRLERKIHKVIRQHDEESVKAQERQEVLDRLRKVNEELMFFDNWRNRGRDDAWGSELLNVGNNGRRSHSEPQTLLDDTSR